MWVWLLSAGASCEMLTPAFVIVRGGAGGEGCRIQRDACVSSPHVLLVWYIGSCAAPMGACDSRVAYSVVSCGPPGRLDLSCLSFSVGPTHEWLCKCTRPPRTTLGGWVLLLTCAHPSSGVLLVGVGDAWDQKKWPRGGGIFWARPCSRPQSVLAVCS
jgi:hypothetical protein